MKLLIVIVNYNGFDLTIDCLKSLAEELSSLQGVRVGLCDNGSAPGEADRLAQAITEHGWSDWVELTTVSPNQGFCGGNNAVIRPAFASDTPPQYLMLLNNDTIVRPNAIKALLDFMDQRPDVGIAGSRLEDPDGTGQVSAFHFANVLSEFDRGMRLGVISKLLSRWLVRQPIPETACQTQWVSGASMIIRREVVQAIGPLDDGYYTYFDDIDYCFNARKAGWPVWYVPDSRVVHLVGQTTGITYRQTNVPAQPKRRATYWFQARRRYYLKNYGCIHTAAADLAFIVGFALWRVRRVIQRRPDADPPHMLADAIRQSVFLKGFKVKPVENPIMTHPDQPVDIRIHRPNDVTNCCE